VKSPPITETAEGHAVAKFLALGLRGHAIGFHVPNERRGAWERIRATAAGALWGMTDYVVFDGGRAICFELKPRGWRRTRLIDCTVKLTEHELRQIEVHKSLRLAGCPVDILETLEEVIGFLRRHGVPLRTQEPGVLSPSLGWACSSKRALGARA
jgi:hypothetical protein